MNKKDLFSQKEEEEEEVKNESDKSKGSHRVSW